MKKSQSRSTSTPSSLIKIKQVRVGPSDQEVQDESTDCSSERAVESQVAENDVFFAATCLVDMLGFDL